jgi:transposase
MGHSPFPSSLSDLASVRDNRRGVFAATVKPMSNFRPINRDTGFLLPPSVDEWLPQRHLARFVVEVVDGLELSELEKAYRGSGSASYHPAMLLGLLIYGYASKVFSSRALERATYDSVAFRFIAGNEHPDHDTIAAFRKRFLGHIEGLFLEVLQLARAMGMLKLGTVALDGTKVHANASRHSALSYGHAKKIEKQLKKEVRQLLALAARADAADVPDGMSIPEELERREERLAAIAAAKATIEARVQEQQQQHYESRLAAREEEQKRSGRKPPGPPPQPPSGGIGAKEQLNLTDEDSRIMKCADGSFEQCYNAQAAVTAGSLLIVANSVTAAANDKEQLVPMLTQFKALPKKLGRIRRVLADAGYLSEKNVEHCEAAKIEPFIALKRTRHHLSLRQRFAPAPKAPPQNATALQRMAHRLKTARGKKLYALRKHTPEPVFGIIKSVMGFRQFSLRGLRNVSGEWNLVTLSWNIKRMFALQSV